LEQCGIILTENETYGRQRQKKGLAWRTIPKDYLKEMTRKLVKEGSGCVEE